MNTGPEDFSKSVLSGAVNVFFGLVKITFILLVLVVGTLVLAQSSVAPVSVQWLTSVSMKRTLSVLKPVRPYFPAPYSVEVETH